MFEEGIEISTGECVDELDKLVGCECFIPKLILNGAKQIKPHSVIIDNVTKRLKHNTSFALHVADVVENMVNIFYTNDRIFI